MKPSDQLLERSDQLGELDRALEAVLTAAAPRLFLVSGEAGVGKSTLVRAFVSRHEGECRVLLGRCEALFTPRPLAPFHDVIQQTGGELTQLLSSGVRPHELATALLEELRRAPSILVLEDIQWADEATLDVLSLLSGRLRGVPAVIIATYRDEELHPAHPLRVTLGSLATSEHVARLALAPLSAAGVAGLVGAGDIDAADLYRRTGGNPFFVTEVIAAGSSQVPATVRDAVLARASRLTEPARAVLEAVAIVPVGCTYWLLEQLTDDRVDQLDECLAAGMLVAGPSIVSFRHELARMTIENELPARRRQRLHQQALQILAAGQTVDVARLAHHAEAAQDRASVRRFAPAAGAAAAALGAHREAAEHYAHAIEAAADAPRDEVGELFEQRAYACYLSGDFPAAVTAQAQALEHHREASDRVRQARAARSLSLLMRYQGDLPAARALGQEALSILDGSDPSHELAMVYCNLSHLGAVSEDNRSTRAWAAKAMHLAAELGDVEVEVYCALNVATIQISAGDRSAYNVVGATLETALEHQIEEQAGRAYVALTWWASRGRLYDTADRYVADGMRYCEERGLSLWHTYLLAYRARAALDRGRWDEARGAAEQVVRNPRTSPVPRLVALAVLGAIAARTGVGDPWPLLDEAWDLARDTGELQRIEPVALARGEALWLAGRDAEVDDATSLAVEVARSSRSPWVMGAVLACRHLAMPADEPLPLPEPFVFLPQPFASELASDFGRAAQEWRALDAPYEAALALARTGEDRDARAALDALHALGAQAAAARVRRALRARGVLGVPRGPRAATRDNPANLTARELEVLDLVAAGWRNSEIAEKLVVSQRTVDHHVAAILRKLNVTTRSDATKAAVELGITTSPRQHPR